MKKNVKHVVLAVSVVFMLAGTGCKSQSSGTAEPEQTIGTSDAAETPLSEESQSISSETDSLSDEDTYPSLALEGQVIYHEENKAVNTYTYTEDWYNNFMQMTNEFDGISRAFVNAVIQGVLESRAGDRGIDVVNSWKEYRSILDDAGIWESMKEDAREPESSTSEKSQLASKTSENQTSKESQTFQGSQTSENNSNNSDSVDSSEIYRRAGYEGYVGDIYTGDDGKIYSVDPTKSSEEEKEEMKKAASEAAENGWDINYDEGEIDPDNRHDSGATYIDENGRIHFD